MKTKGHLGFITAVAVVAVGAGMAILAQRQHAALLRIERDTVRRELGDLERLRVENLRLRALQIPAAELKVLRADHAALPRLRAELEALKPR